MSAVTLTVEIDEAPASAAPYILKTWRESYRDSKEGRALWRDRRYYETVRPRIEAIFDSKSTQAAVARLQGSDTIVGFAVWSGEVLHYVSVRHAYRLLGIGRQLIEHTGAKRAERWTYALQAAFPALAEAAMGGEK